ncbi:MAG: EAL domain-containing protein [Lysobacter sp.]
MALIPILLLARRHTSLPALLRNGLRRRQFFLHYQPIVELATGRCVGAEAVIRWQRHDGSFVRPDLFIPVAEECGLIRKVTARVMELLRHDATTILDAYPDLMISFNLAPEDMRSEQILDELRELLDTKNVHPENLHIEMTERGILNTDHAREIVQAIRELGIRVAIDDFGTGFSSLSYLTTFEVDYLKIDKAFVDPIGTAAATSQVAMHIIKMAKELNLMMIAEGVETEEQATILRNAGVQYAQGWLFAKAMDPAALCNFVTSSRRPCSPIG